MQFKLGIQSQPGKIRHFITWDFVKDLGEG